MRLGFPQSDLGRQDVYKFATRQNTPHRLGGQPAQQSATAARFRSRTSLTVETAEGDRITISLNADARLATTSRIGLSHSEQTDHASSSTSARVSVQGELSEAELGDITKLIDALGTTTNSQSNGTSGLDNLEKSLSGLDTIAQFQLSHRQTIEVGAVFSVAA